MRNFLLGLPFLLLLPVMIFAAMSDDNSDLALVSVDNPGADTTARLLASNLMVVRQMQSYLLAVVSSEQLSWMEDQGLRCRVLDQSVTGNSYYTLGMREADQLHFVESQVAVLRYEDREVVIRAKPSEAEKLSADGFEIARIFLRPVRLPPVIKPVIASRYRTTDPEIQMIVDAVSSTIIDAHVQRLQDFVTRYATHDSCQAAAEYIHAQFVDAGIDSVYFHQFNTLYKDNVVAVIPGESQPQKTIVVGGHYDSITSNINNCPGADDDASGTACVLECARVLSGHQFEYTLKFVAFCAEEQGLLGSEAFASEAAANGEDIVAAVCVDMIGYLAGGDVMDLDIVDNASSQWIRDLVVDIAPTYVPDLPVVDGSLPFGASSDHASFWANGYDGILLFEDTGSYSPYIHTNNDVVGLSYNSSLLADRSVKIAAALLATLARPFNVAISHLPLSHTEDTVNPYRVKADIISSSTLNPDSLLVYYSTGNGMTSLPLIHIGSGDDYEAFIPPQPAGTFVGYYLVAEDIDGNRAAHPSSAPEEVHNFFVGTINTVVAHDMEVEQGWSVGDGDDDATSGIWERADPNGVWEGSILVQPEYDHTLDPGMMCFVTGNDPSGSNQGVDDVDGGKTTLFSPVFDLSLYPNAYIRYWRWYTNDTGYNPGGDEWVVDVSADGGVNWVRLETLGSSERSWQLVERNIGELIPLTNQVQFRFVASDDDQGSVIEAAVDDFSIVVFQIPATGINPTADSYLGAITLGPNIPNPFNPVTTINFHVANPGQKVTLRIFDVTGRVVATLIEDETVVGRSSVVWRGQDDQGRDVASGVYFYRIEADGQNASQKLLLVR